MQTKTIPMLIVAVGMICGAAHSQTNQAPEAEAAVPAAAPQEPAAAPLAQEPAPAAAAVTNSPATVEEQPILINPAATLPEAVQALARAAGINFLFDPKLVNQVGPDGKPVPPPAIGVEIRWEKVTPAQALTALLDNYGWQMTMDPKSKIYRVSAKDPTAVEPFVTSVFQLKYTNPTNIQSQLTSMFPKCKIVPDLRTSQLVVMTPERDIPALESLIGKLDNPTKQVLIEAKILETTKNPKSMKGIDWTGTLGAQHLTYGNGSTTSTKTETTTPTAVPGAVGGNGVPFPGHMVDAVSGQTKTTTENTGNGMINSAAGWNPSIAFLNADGVSAVMSFLNTDAETESLSLPRTVAQDGVPTELAVVRNVPVFEQEQSAGSQGGQNLATAKPNYNLKVGQTTINEVGVKLKVTPRIVGITNVFLDLNPEISAQELLPARFTMNGQVNEAPIFSRRKITTQATVPTGNTLVLGGLTSDNTSKSFVKVPILGDIPGLGLLFRHDTKERNKQNLLIFVTPTIIEDADFQLTKTDFLKTKFVPKPDSEESPLDTGKPKDWTKTKNKVEPAYNPDSNK